MQPWACGGGEGVVKRAMGKGLTALSLVMSPAWDPEKSWAAPLGHTQSSIAPASSPDGVRVRSTYCAVDGPSHIAHLSVLFRLLLLSCPASRSQLGSPAARPGSLSRATAQRIAVGHGRISSGHPSGWPRGGGRGGGLGGLKAVPVGLVCLVWSIGRRADIVVRAHAGSGMR